MYIYTHRFDEKLYSNIVSQYFPTKYLLIMKGKELFYIEEY